MSASELSIECKGVYRTGLSRVFPGINCRGSKERVKRGLSRRPWNYPSGVRERVGRDWLRRPRNYPSGAKERVGRGLLRRPRNYPSGAKERVGRDWLRRPRNDPSSSTERVGRGWLRQPRNYPPGEREHVGPGWLHLWWVAGLPSVDCSPKGDAPSSPELTVGADGDAVDRNAPRSVTYGRRGGI